MGMAGVITGLIGGINPGMKSSIISKLHSSGCGRLLHDLALCSGLVEGALCLLRVRWLGLWERTGLTRKFPPPSRTLGNMG